MTDTNTNSRHCTKRSHTLIDLVLSVALVASLAFIGIQLALTEPTPSQPTIQVTNQQPEEDEPGWDCHTMGNLICGPTSGTAS